MTKENLLGERLKALRAEKGFPLSQVAAEISISQGALSDYERGRKLPGCDAITKLAQYYQVSSDYLIGLSDAKRLDNSNIVSRLGLSEKVIERLNFYNGESKRSYAHEYYETGCTPIELIDALFVALLTDADAVDLLVETCTLMRRAHKDNVKSVDSLPSSLDVANEICDMRKRANEIGYEVIGGRESVELSRFRFSQAMNRVISAAVAEHETEYADYLLEEEIAERISILNSRIERVGDHNNDIRQLFQNYITEIMSDPNASKRQVLERLRDVYAAVSFESRKSFARSDTAGDPDGDD